MPKGACDGNASDGPALLHLVVMSKEVVPPRGDELA